MISPLDKTKCIQLPPFLKLPRKLPWTMYTFLSRMVIPAVTRSNARQRAFTRSNARQRVVTRGG